MKGKRGLKKNIRFGLLDRLLDNNGSVRDIFVRRFVLWLVVFTIVLVPVQAAFGKLGNMRLFSGTESLMGEVDTLVSADSEFYEEFSGSKRVNVLVLGLNDGLSDVMMVGSYDLKNQRVDIISVPRDTYYYRPAYYSAGAQKINSIYHTDGLVPTVEAVSEVLLGMPINYYVIVDYEAIEAIVDEMGGVPMYIEHRMEYHDPYDDPPLHIEFEAGDHILNGEDAVKFLRFRKGIGGYSEGDIGRIGAHQQFVKNAISQALDHGIVDVAKVAFEEIESDVTLDIIVKVARKAINLDVENIYTWTVPGSAGMSNGASYYFADAGLTEEMIDQIYNFEDYIVETTEGAIEAE